METEQYKELVYRPNLPNLILIIPGIFFSLFLAALIGSLIRQMDSGNALRRAIILIIASILILVILILILIYAIQSLFLVLHLQSDGILIRLYNHRKLHFRWAEYPCFYHEQSIRGQTYVILSKTPCESQKLHRLINCAEWKIYSKYKSGQMYITIWVNHTRSAQKFCESVKKQYELQ